MPTSASSPPQPIWLYQIGKQISLCAGDRPPSGLLPDGAKARVICRVPDMSRGAARAAQYAADNGLMFSAASPR